jgi:AraC family transcriptional regulator
MIVVNSARHFAGLSDRAAPCALAGWQLKRIASRIEEQPGELPTIAELAELCHISVRHLTRGYRAATGHTLGETMRKVQIAYASECLARTGLSIADIAGKVGFSSGPNFATAFRRSTGLSPSEYRRRHH